MDDEGSIVTPLLDPNAIEINDTLLTFSFFAALGLLFLILWIQDWYEQLSARRRWRRYR